MRIVVRLDFLLVVVALLSACTSRSSESPRAASLHQEWFPYAGFAGEVSAARRFAPGEGITLRVVPGAEDVDPVKLVISGSADFAVASSDLVVAAVSKGAPLVAIGVINQISPTCFLVRGDSGIHKPADFVGRRVGILPGTNTERVYELMMKRSQVDRSRINEVPIPFELQTFILGQYDVRPAFAYDEPVTLAMQNFPYSLIAPEQFGVHLMGTVYFTRRDVVSSQPEMVQKVVNSLVKGWKFALQDPADAVTDLVAEFPTLNAQRERRSLELAKAYFGGENGRPLFASNSTWQGTLQDLADLGVIHSKAVTVADVWDSRFVEKAYAAR